ncbi:tRNA (adenosine(37)-N6)-threonylcarbamoyltransferase complex dimerization subunit type 1 TsaB [Salisediminibacterium halotolerans]|uniref:tRNA threonylcarbamoyladenosine biosynthesis protein TsaB n=1 Tax=Salisediminibacterium halotolerans TaxID=517425 RepID=A0A1H9TCA2_9BACI|nr:tRNA (adenosine(37)-N6)-threonylcarbamoyltransferase complex dimerization subunit type 1 TsaB [Salisediminibacterium haloalkalitolerans]SER94875.1 tRNA threonylcarbamoyladenosine biosynthesis protein TsaB [Salisediminibacterium haloalkalitolerans]
MNVLAIDTSSYVMGTALVKDSLPLGEITTHEKKNHSLRLAPAIRQLLRQTDMQENQLDRIAVTEGPGSYTGVRIGITTAKTMAWALGIPLVALSSMELLAQNGRYFDGWIVPFYDARRTQLYTGLFTCVNGEIERRETDQMKLLEDLLHELKNLDGPVLFLSPDRLIHEQRIREVLGDQAVFGAPLDGLPRPGELAQLAVNREPVADLHSFTPNYIRLAEAEAKWRAARAKAEDSSSSQGD